MSAEIDRKEIDDKDGNWPSDEKVKDDQGDAEYQYIFVEYMQEWIVEHDHTKNKQDEPGISPRQFASHFHGNSSWLVNSAGTKTFHIIVDRTRGVDNKRTSVGTV
jgi:hypothetical protein